MMLKRTLAVIAFAFSCALPGVPAISADAVPGHVILARTGANALVIWDASPEISSILAAKLSADDANARLERDALRALSGEMRALGHAASITVRVIYAKTGDVSPVYNSPTFAGIERYAELKLDGPSAASNKDAWQQLAPDAKIPPWITFTILGALPPS